MHAQQPQSTLAADAQSKHDSGAFTASDCFLSKQLQQVTHNLQFLCCSEPERGAGAAGGGSVVGVSATAATGVLTLSPSQEEA